MRNGVILTENSPQAIISNCHCDTIEEGYLLLSQKQECEEKVGSVTYNCDFIKVFLTP